MIVRRGLSVGDPDKLAGSCRPHQRSGAKKNHCSALYLRLPVIKFAINDFPLGNGVITGCSFTGGGNPAAVILSCPWQTHHLEVQAGYFYILVFEIRYNILGLTR